MSWTSDPDVMEASMTKLGVWWVLVVILASSRRSFWLGVYGDGATLSTTPCHRRRHAAVRREEPRESTRRTSYAASSSLLARGDEEFDWYTVGIT